MVFVARKPRHTQAISGRSGRGKRPGGSSTRYPHRWEYSSAAAPGTPKPCKHRAALRIADHMVCKPPQPALVLSQARRRPRQVPTTRAHVRRLPSQASLPQMRPQMLGRAVQGTMTSGAKRAAASKGPQKTGARPLRPCPMWCSSMPASCAALSRSVGPVSVSMTRCETAANK